MNKVGFTIYAATLKADGIPDVRATVPDETSARRLGRLLLADGFTDVRVHTWNDRAEEYSELVL
jgi:hypothetical protein